jgi:hypothetical protein
LPLAPIVDIEVWHLVEACGQDFVFCDKNAAQMRVSVMHDLLWSWFRFLIRCALVYRSKIYLAIVCHVADLGRIRWKWYVIYPSIAWKG